MNVAATLTTKTTTKSKTCQKKKKVHFMKFMELQLLSRGHGEKKTDSEAQMQTGNEERPPPPPFCSSQPPLCMVLEVSCYETRGDPDSANM